MLCKKNERKLLLIEDKVNNLQKNWQSAATDLKIQIKTNFTVNLSNNIIITVDLLVLSFGAKKGMLIVSDYDKIYQHTEELIDLGYGYSNMNIPKENEAYDRDSVIGILQDWGWSGKEQPPKWY